MPKKVFLGFRLSPDLRKQLEEIAAHEERSLSQICELLLRKGVESYRKEGAAYFRRMIAGRTHIS
jgi:hypothetical protein